MLKLEQFIGDLADAFRAVDSTGPKDKNYKPGIGPLSEKKTLDLVIWHLGKQKPELYAKAGPCKYPDSRRKCDLVIPSSWAMEAKMVRPFGDNNQEDEHWFENILYPYPKKYNNDSSISDCFKLWESKFEERKAIIVFGYEHLEVKIALEPAIRAFELIASQITGFSLSQRIETAREPLIHPVHQRLRIFIWEILSRRENFE